MQVIVTAGPTREYIDTVRFITNASSGQMGCETAQAAAEAGHQVTLLLATGASARASDKIDTARFTSVGDLKDAIEQRFESCDVLIMAAAVGDFRTEKTLPAKIHRRSGPITLKLFPTEDILADLGRRKRPGQLIIAFAVEDAPPGEIEAKARSEMAAKNADYVVVNTPQAMAEDSSFACILGPDGTILDWGNRPKSVLAREIVKLLSGR